MLDPLAAPRVLVDVVPAVVVERAGKERRAEHLAHLCPRLPDLELLDEVLGEVIALVDVELVHAELLDVGHVGLPRPASPEEDGKDGGDRKAGGVHGAAGRSVGEWLL